MRNFKELSTGRLELRFLHQKMEITATAKELYQRGVHTEKQIKKMFHKCGKYATFERDC